MIPTGPQDPARHAPAPTGVSDDGMTELANVEARYARRGASEGLYSFLRPEVLFGQFDFERALMALLLESGFSGFGDLRLIEIGCGSGGNLLRLLRWGFDPSKLVANELLPDRLDAARKLLPAAVEIVPGDARVIDRPGAFDLVYQSTVLSSILDDDFQQQLANTMWSLTAPGGAVLSYDFAVDNPKNKDVRGVPVKRLRQLFPEGTLALRRVTLAPPLARRFGTTRFGYSTLNALPLLRSHRLVLISKPRAGGAR